MSRPEKNRKVYEPPLITGFKPMGIQSRHVQHTILTLDEYEAFRLSDFNGLSHAEAAEEMEISRSTFTRLIEKARKKIADLIICGKMLNIEGGNIHFKVNIFKCQHCEQMFKIRINMKLDKCPSCHSKNLLNLAGGFGHGKCCQD
jgi:predicted DNA-binding protein (UPF0251 family)